MQLASDELQLRVVISSAAVVGESDPAVKVRGFLVAAYVEDVVRGPTDVGGEIGSLDALRFGSAIFERPDQGGPAVEIVRQVGKAIGIGRHAGDNFVANFSDGPVVVRQEQRFGLDVLRGICLLLGANQADVAADVLLQELLRIEQVVFVILLEDRASKAR